MAAESAKRRSAPLLALGAGLLALAATATLRVCLVEGRSMEPTLQDGCRVLVWRPVGELARGDLVVIRNPGAPEELLVKRVIALPLERIRSEGGRVVVGLGALDEPYLAGAAAPLPIPLQTVPAGCYFVLGDRREESVDSRQFGPLERSLVVGRVLGRIGLP